MRYLHTTDTEERRLINLIRVKMSAQQVYKCRDCKKKIGRWSYGSGMLVIHHKKPISRGGTTTKDNLVILCPKCHSGRHKILKRNPERGNNDQNRN